MPALRRLWRLTVGSMVASLVVAGSLNAGRATARTGGPSTHTVASGDTLSSIARRTGASVAALAAANRLSDIHHIRVGARLVVPAPAPSTAGAERVVVVDVKRLPARLLAQPQRLALVPQFDAAAREFGVPADLLKALTWQESGWQNHKVSSARALGIGQLIPATVAFVNQSLLRGANLDPRRPEHNIRMSARFLAYLLQRTGGDVRLAVSAYYQGLASVQRRGPYEETRRYADDVLALRKFF